MGKKRKKSNRVAGTSGGVPGRSKNIEKLAKKLFVNEDERELFLVALTTDSAKRAIAWIHESTSHNRSMFADVTRASWIPEFIQLTGPNDRPGASEAHEEGDIYCLDLSSVFAAVPLMIVPQNPNIVLDMCAAPGGKGIVGWRTLKPHSIIFNEVIRKRTAQLIANVRRCRIPTASVVSNDPRDLGVAYKRHADVVIVDAPCSGQSLLARNLAAPGAFHPATISANAQRQRRILAHSQQCVKVGGYLLYSTCTFSPEENEETVRWFTARFPQFSTCEVPPLEQFGSDRDGLCTYRLYPHYGFGAGAFCALLKCTDAPVEVEDNTFSLSPIRLIYPRSM